MLLRVFNDVREMLILREKPHVKICIYFQLCKIYIDIEKLIWQKMNQNIKNNYSGHNLTHLLLFFFFILFYHESFYTIRRVLLLKSEKYHSFKRSVR